MWKRSILNFWTFETSFCKMDVCNLYNFKKKYNNFIILLICSLIYALWTLICHSDLINKFYKLLVFLYQNDNTFITV